MKKNLIFILMFLLVYSCKIYPQQHSFGPQLNNYRTSLFKTASTGVLANRGLLPENQMTEVGKRTGTFYRSLYQWDIPDNVIPDNATIDSVRITYQYSKSLGNYDLAAEFYRIPADISISNPNWSNIWDQFTDGNKIAEKSNLPNNTFGSIPNPPIYTYNDMPKLCDAVKRSLPENRFLLGIMSGAENATEDDFFYMYPGLIEINIYYRLPHQTVTVTQILSTGAGYGNVGHYEGNSFIDRITGTPYSFELGSTEFFRADTNKATVADEKFNNWNNSSNVLNHSAFPIDSTTELIVSRFYPIGNATVRNALEGSVSAGNIEFRDPWLRDDNSDSRGLRNRGSGAIWHSYISPFIQDISSTKFKGVLLNQTVKTENSNYYSVKAQNIKDIFLPQLGRNQRFYFQGWSAVNATLTSPSNIESGYYVSPVVFTGNNSEIMANYKGTLLSNTSTAFSNTSQRKFVRTDNGYLHLVYESMNHIWYERSTNNGSSWQIMNGGKYLDQGATQSKLPSITTMFNEIAIVWQEKYDESCSAYKIKLARFDENSLCRYIKVVYNSSFDGLNCETAPQYYSNADPVVTFNQSSTVLVCWKKEIPDDPASSGIWYKFGKADIAPYGPDPRGDTLTWFQESMIPGTTINSYTPTVALSLLGQEFALAWEQREYYSSIKFARLFYTPSNGCYTISNITQETISNFSYYQKHYKPSLSIINQNSGGGKLELGWVGERTYYENGVQKVMKNALYRRDTYSTSTNTWNWSGGSMSLGSSSVTAVNVNTTNYDGVVGWNESGLMNRYIRTSNPYSTRTFNTGSGLTGVSLQINNSPDFNSMYALVFKNSTLPYSFMKSDSVAVLGKTGPDAPSSRIAVARLDSAVFYISSRLSLDGKNLGFSAKGDSIKSYDVKTIEEALSTSAFTPEAASTISYNIEYGTLDTLYSMKALSKGGMIQCRLELQDESNGSTLKVLEKFSLDKLTMKGIDGSFRSLSGSMEVRKFAGRSLCLKLVFEDGINARWGLMERVLGPEDEKEIKKITSEKVVDYALSQNYPNPFNPSTVISYDIPKASKVSLKIYDMLGREIATLVDEVKGEGKYSVEFNASHLPSGIYIYEIRANDFVRSGKMMLLK